MRSGWREAMAWTISRAKAIFPVWRGRHSRASTGRHTGRDSNGRSTTIPATTQQLPNPIGLGPLAAPSWCQATPNTFLPERLNRVSSTTTVIADPFGSSRSTIRSSRASPTASALLPLAESAQFRLLKVPSLEYSPVVVVPLLVGCLAVTDLEDPFWSGGSRGD